MTLTLIALAALAQTPGELSTQVGELKHELASQQAKLQAVSAEVGQRRNERNVRETERLARVSDFGEALDNLHSIDRYLVAGDDSALGLFPLLLDRLHELRRESHGEGARQTDLATQAVVEIADWIDQRDYTRARQAAAIATTHLSRARASAEAVP